MKLYTLDNQFIEETKEIPLNYTGIIGYANGTKEWYVNWKRHRLDGPAIEWADGTKEWWLEDKWHRLDGPAIEHSNGSKEWWIDDKPVTEEQCKLLYSIMKLKGLTL